MEDSRSPCPDQAGRPTGQSRKRRRGARTRRGLIEVGGGRGGRTRIPPGARTGRRQPAARCSGMAACARSGGDGSPYGSPTFRSQRRAPLSTLTPAGAADPAVVVQPHAASGSFGDHHAKRPSLRPPPCGDADDRSARASADRSAWWRSPDLLHGRRCSDFHRCHDLLSRMLRQYPELGDAETGTDGPGLPTGCSVAASGPRFRSSPSCGSRREAGSLEMDAGRGGRRRGGDAQHPDRKGIDDALLPTPRTASGDLSRAIRCACCSRATRATPT